jgi:uncharacterized membrane protein
VSRRAKKREQAGAAGRPAILHAAAAPIASAARQARIEPVDALRGLAICLMIVYHFCFDLNHFGFLHQDFNYDPFWLSFRGIIVTLFLFTVGISLQLARESESAGQRFLVRLAKVSVCALLVSLGSYLMFPSSFIYFGILHFIAVASVLAWPLRRAGTLNLAIAAAALVVGNWVALAWFDAPSLQWIGLMTRKPLTEDYVPLLPWFGVVALGLFAGDRLLEARAAARERMRWEASPLAWMGRRSLLIYMIHQPILIGLVWLLRSAGGG